MLMSTCLPLQHLELCAGLYAHNTQNCLKPYCMQHMQCPESSLRMSAEMEALGGVLGSGAGGQGRQLALASVKSVYGHTEGAAGEWPARLCSAYCN